MWRWLVRRYVGSDSCFWNVSRQLCGTCLTSALCSPKTPATVNPLTSRHAKSLHALPACVCVSQLAFSHTPATLRSVTECCSFCVRSREWRFLSPSCSQLQEACIPSHWLHSFLSSTAEKCLGFASPSLGFIQCDGSNVGHLLQIILQICDWSGGTFKDRSVRTVSHPSAFVDQSWKFTRNECLMPRCLIRFTWWKWINKHAAIIARLTGNAEWFELKWGIGQCFVGCVFNFKKPLIVNWQKVSFSLFI